MPSVKFWGISLRPFAGDDIHVVCFVLIIYRVVQLCAIIPLAIHFLVQKSRQQEIMCQGSEDDVNFDAQREDERRSFLSGLIFGTFFYDIGDLALIMSIWSAASVGTPTETVDRDKFLRPLLKVKASIMNCFLISLIVNGLLFVSYNREDNYGCNTEQDSFEDSMWYGLYSTIIFFLCLELLLIPCLVIANIVADIRKFVKTTLQTVHTKNSSSLILQTCMAGCFKCLGLIGCFKSGGKEIRMRELKDAAEALLDFFRDGDIMDIVLSDLYVSLKMKARVQRQIQFESVMEALKCWTARDVIYSNLKKSKQKSPSDISSFGDDNAEKKKGKLATVKSVSLLVGDIPADESISPGGDTNDLKSPPRTVVDQNKTQKLERSKGQRISYNIKKNRDIYNLSSRNMLQAQNDNDSNLLRDAACFMRYSDAIYDSILDFIRAYAVQFSKERMQVFSVGDHEEDLYLDAIGFESTKIVYANFQNGISATPYCILVDHTAGAIVVAIRGTASFEDMIVDLQLTPSCLEDVAKKCGFDGANEYCHKGVLTRSEWIYDDIEKYKILEKLRFGEDPQFPHYRLVITGHSLGAGCAALVSIMFRKQFPKVECFAFCPPGGLFSERLAESCKYFVTSFVNNTDVIPRMSLKNLEQLRDSAFETLASIKVPKVQLYKVLQRKCNDEDLSSLNALLLYSPENMPKDTDFFSQLEKFRSMKRRQGSRSVHLFIPGSIIHVVKACTVNNSIFSSTYNYLPQWADKDDFNEILLSPTLVGDHSTSCVIANLDAVVKSFEEDSKEVEKENTRGSIQVGFLTERNEMFSIDSVHTPTFVCCAKPHGKKPLLVGLLATLTFAIIVLYSSNSCILVKRSTTYFDDEGREQPTLGYAMGLFTFQGKTFVGELDNIKLDDFENDNFCTSYPHTVPIDGYLKTARVLATLSMPIGFIATAGVWFSTCVRYSRWKWRVWNTCFFLATLCRGLIFLIFKSEICRRYTFVGNEYFSTCTLGKDGFVEIASAVGWFICGVLTFSYPGILTDSSDLPEDETIDNITVSHVSPIISNADAEGNDDSVHDIEDGYSQASDSEQTHFIPWRYRCLFVSGFRIICTLSSGFALGFLILALITLKSFLGGTGWFS